MGSPKKKQESEANEQDDDRHPEVRVRRDGLQAASASGMLHW
jgi:hypothetical protein